MANKLDLVPLNDWGFFHLPPRPCVVAGPCSAESEEQVMETARGLKAIGINVFRAGIWKPRTHPGSFEGAGVPGLKWMQKVRKEYGMRICTEVANERHVFECLKHGVDMVWLGARTTANPFMVEEVCAALRGSNMQVMVKNPVSPDLKLWIGAIERLQQAGIDHIAAVHRGFSVYHWRNDQQAYRNDPLWEVALEFRRQRPDIPILCDPSHIGGDSRLVTSLALAAVQLDCDGLMIEVHNDPSKALCDGAQSLNPQQFDHLMGDIRRRVAFEEKIRELIAEGNKIKRIIR